MEIVQETQGKFKFLTARIKVLRTKPFEITINMPQTRELNRMVSCSSLPRHFGTHILREYVWDCQRHTALCLCLLCWVIYKEPRIL